MLYVGQVSGLVEDFNIWIYLDTINVINVKLRMMVLLIELYLFVPLSYDHISRSKERRTVLTENFVFLSNKVKTL